MSQSPGFSWEMVAALGTWTTIVGAVLWALMRTTIRAEISEAIRSINGTYVRSAGSQITGHEIERRLDLIDGRRVARAHGD